MPVASEADCCTPAPSHRGLKVPLKGGIPPPGSERGCREFESLSVAEEASARARLPCLSPKSDWPRMPFDNKFTPLQLGPSGQGSSNAAGSSLRRALAAGAADTKRPSGGAEVPGQQRRAQPRRRPARAPRLCSPPGRAPRGPHGQAGGRALRGGRGVRGGPRGAGAPDATGAGPEPPGSAPGAGRGGASTGGGVV